MKRLMVSVLCAVVLGGCSQQKPTYRNVKLITDQSWPVGEARWCSGFDGQWNEIHCFPPEQLSARKYNYLMDVYSGGPMQFDPQQWAYDITCRLDSFTRATCHQAAGKKGQPPNPK